MLELDCHLTKDGQVVVCHDHNLSRSTGTDKNISELNYQDLPLLKSRLQIDFDPGIFTKKSMNSRMNNCKTIMTNVNTASLNMFKFYPLEVEYIGSAKEEDRKFALLHEVFEAFPNIPINIDVKVNDDRLISKISDLIKQFKREDYTVWGNFSDEITQKCYNTVCDHFFK